MSTVTTTTETVARFTVIDATVPDRLTKTYSLDEDGELVKSPGGQLAAGTAIVAGITDIGDLVEYLGALETSQAITYGVPQAAEVGTTFQLLTKKEFQARGRPEGLIARTNADFPFVAAPGVFMADHDAPKDGSPPMTEEELVEAIGEACPMLGDVKMVTASSASSYIFNTETAEELKGAGGLRVYFMVEDASDIPRAGKVLIKRLWLAGYGRYDVGAAGQLLDGAPLDSSVWQGSRLDFASGAECVAPLEQRRPAPTVWEGDVGIVDTRTSIPDLTDEEEAELLRIQREAKAAVQGEVIRVKNERAEAIADVMVGEDASPTLRREAMRHARQAMDGGVLHTTFPIHVMKDDEIETVSVADLLNDPGSYHGLETLDPVEPDYDGARFVGKLFLDGRRPNLYSFAHGGRNFRLQREAVTLRIAGGETRQAVSQTLDVLREVDDVFDMKSALAVVDNGHLSVPNASHFEHVVAGHIAYEKFDGRSGRWVRIDPPKKVIDQIIGKGEARKLQPLEGSSGTPLILPTGQLVTEPGYDPVSKLFLFDSPALREIKVPEAPTLHQCRMALVQLWWPFRLFPFVDDVDRGVFLAALLTAVDRQAMETAPAFAMDAPIRGSGKTLLAECLSLLAGDSGGTMPPVFGNEEEVRKRMTSNVMQNTKVSITDNVFGIVRSVALSQALTSGVYRDRILGVSEVIDMPYKVMEVLTGNNVVISGDLARRVVVCRIDPKMENAFTRSFPFSPKEYVRENRMEMVAAALTLIRGAMLWKGRGSVGGLASFDDWNEIVRKTVVFAGEMVDDDIGFGDPVDSINDVYENDTEQETHADLLRALRGVFGGGVFTAAEVITKLPSRVGAYVGNPADRALQAALAEIDGKDKVWSAKGLGHAFMFRKDTVVDGLCLKRVKKVDDIWRWRIAKVDEDGNEARRVRRHGPDTVAHAAE